MKKYYISIIAVLISINFFSQSIKDLNINIKNYNKNFYQKFSSPVNLKNNSVNIYKCEEQDGSATFEFVDIKRELINNNEFTDIQAQVFICDENGNIIQVNNLNKDNPSITSICNNLSIIPDGDYLFDIAVDSNEDIYVSVITGIYKINSVNCSALLISNTNTFVNALSFDTQDNLYINSGSSVLRAEFNNLNSFSIWHTFSSGTSSGDFVILGDKMYIAWKVYGFDHLYEVTIDSSFNYLSHIDLGILPDNTYGLASELGILYGVTPNQLYKININNFSVETVLENPTLSSWFGAAGLHEAIDLEIKFYNNLIDANTGNNQLLEDKLFTPSRTIYVVIENTNTGESIISPLNLNVITSNLTPIDDVVSCDSYILPKLNSGNYFTEKNGEGTQLFSGDVIINTQDIYVYEVTETDPSCVNEIKFNIVINTSPKVDLIDDVSTCSVYKLPPLLNGKYYTEPNAEGIEMQQGDMVTSSQRIYIHSKDSLVKNCTNESSFYINLIEKPKYFTPNEDGINDTWKICNHVKYSKSKLFIFNRFGKVVFKTNDIEIGWNGKYNGKKLPSNDYWYFIVLQNGEIEKGYFSLLRK